MTRSFVANASSPSPSNGHFASALRIAAWSSVAPTRTSAMSAPRPATALVSANARARHDATGCRSNATRAA